MPIITSPESLLDALSTAMLFVNPDFRVLHMNAASEVMLGTSRKMAEGRTIFEAIPCCVEIRRQLELARDNLQVYTERDLEVPMGENRKITLDCVITPLFEDSISAGHLVIELTQVDRRLRISREDHLLSQGEGTRGLLRGVAHEIKNPLGGIRGAAQLLAAELQLLDDDDVYTEYTDVITHEVDRLQALVDQMLGPRQVPRFKETNIHEILEQVRRLVEAEPGLNAKIICDYDPSLPEIKADGDMLQQAFLNLVRNALQAAQRAEQPELIIRTRPERQFTIGHKTHRLVSVVQFIDNGPGIPEDMLETIFLPMVTSKVDGTGLGLPIAQSLIQHHGGLIEFDSQPGRTCFTVYLPMEANHASQ